MNTLHARAKLSLCASVILYSALLVSGCGGTGGHGQTVRPPVDPPETPQTTNTPTTTPESPRSSTNWWLPDNTRALVQGEEPSLTAQEIPQKLVDTGDTAISSSELTAVPTKL